MVVPSLAAVVLVVAATAAAVSAAVPVSGVPPAVATFVSQPLSSLLPVALAAIAADFSGYTFASAAHYPGAAACVSHHCSNVLLLCVSCYLYVVFLIVPPAAGKETLDELQGEQLQQEQAPPPPPAAPPAALSVQTVRGPGVDRRRLYVNPFGDPQGVAPPGVRSVEASAGPLAAHRVGAPASPTLLSSGCGAAHVSSKIWG